MGGRKSIINEASLHCTAGHPLSQLLTLQDFEFLMTVYFSSMQIISL